MLCGLSSLWPFRFVAFSVGGRFGLWPFQSVAISICVNFGIWPFWFCPFRCGLLGCGLFGLWPFRLWPFRSVAVMTCYRNILIRRLVNCFKSWREHPSYCRTTVGIRPLGFLSAVGFCKPHPTTSPHHLPSLFAQHWAYSTSNTLIYSFDVRWLGTALSPTSYILQFCRIWIFIYIIIFSGKFYMKSKLQRCLYINFYQN